MKRFSILSAAAIAVLAACGGSSKPPTFKQPAGTTAVNFSVDDTANKVFTDSTLPDGGVGPSDLQWKGAMLYDPATNKVSADSSWGGPFAALYDDGPWTAGGHEPEGSSGGDHIFGVTVFVTPPASGSGDTYSYGLNDGSIKLTSTVIDPNGWIWPSSTNGSFTVAPAAAAPVKADGVTLKKFGTTDVQFSVNTSALAPGAWDTSVISVKSSAWGWSGIKFTSDDGDSHKAYSTPTLIEIDGQPQLISPSAEATIAYDPRNGEELWRVHHGGMNEASKPVILAGCKASRWARRLPGPAPIPTWQSASRATWAATTRRTAPARQRVSTRATRTSPFRNPA